MKKLYLKIVKLLMRVYFGIINWMHRPFMKKGAVDPFHAVFKEFICLTKQKPSSSILEIGPGDISNTKKNLFSHCEEYFGLDILAREGVDIVGDAHKISESCRSDYFDFVFSISVFEHLLFPWKAVLEINKVMKLGGYVFLSTHPVWPTHSLPWDFWRFPGNGFHALFNKYTGFEIISLTEGLPAKIYSLVDDAPTRNMYFYTVNQGVALIARKIDNYRSDLLKWDIDVGDVVDTMYPSRQKDEKTVK